MDEQRQRIAELHRRRREIVAQELKAYLSPSGDAGLWATIGMEASEVTKSIRRSALGVLAIYPKRDN